MPRAPARKNEPQDHSSPPFLRRVETVGAVDRKRFPFSIPAFRNGISLELRHPVSFFVGENGSGKSTLLEAIAHHCGFNLEGGSRNHRHRTREENPPLASHLRLSWLPKVTRGFFLRAESFFNFATHIDDLAADNPDLYDAYGGRSLHAQSHGESFLALFSNRLGNGVYILDEPEAALSPQRQLSFLKIVHDLEKAGSAQFLIATHSPMMLAYPGAEVFNLDASGIEPIRYEDTEHYRLTLEFLQSPDRYFRHLFADPD